LKYVSKKNPLATGKTGARILGEPPSCWKKIRISTGKKMKPWWEETPSRKRIKKMKGGQVGGDQGKRGKGREQTRKDEEGKKVPLARRNLYDLDGVYCLSRQTV